MSKSKRLRTETDSMGEVRVAADRYWGAQTQRALEHFSIGVDRIPIEVVHAIALIKKASARVNRALGLLAAEPASWIERAADEVLAGKLDDHFPLGVWMTGSGTQSNMNVNEVIANRAIELAGGRLGSKDPVHPNDHVNMSQSSNDVFPTAICIASAQLFKHRLIPAVARMRDDLAAKARAWGDVVKIGRTHLQDAVPLTLGQELSGYETMLADNLSRLEWTLGGVYRLAIGGTAVGTGLNAPAGFGERVAAEIATLTNLPFTSASNKFAVQGAHDALVMASGALKTLACSLLKIANDIRLLACGPRAGLHELVLPANEPGSSIMPGKVNPTQCEALAMIATQVIGYDTAVAIAGAGGYLEMNVYKPLIAFNIVQSVLTLSDGCDAFTSYLLAGMEPDRDRIDSYLHNSLMLVTAISPLVGYDKASELAHYADEHGCSLAEANDALGVVSAEEFARIVDPYKMAYPHR